MLKSEKELDNAAALLVEQLLDRLQAGEVNVESFIDANPEHAQMLRHLLPALRIMADMSSSTTEAKRIGSAKSPTLPGSLGDLRLIREIGHGGMGVVYEAEQISLQRLVAVKILPFASLWTESALERFRNEVRIAAMLEHPNIVPIYGMGCERGVYFYAMKLVDGCSLSEVIGQRKIQAAEHSAESQSTDPNLGSVVDTVVAVTTFVIGDDNWYRAVARLGQAAATALAFAHQQGVIHRDIKPSNLLLDRQGRLFVADFGLARFESDVSLTRTGDLLGTPRYMSPEQASGSSKQLDPRTDIYSLGATLYELLTLRPVISGPSRAAAIRQLQDLQVAAPRTHDANIPLALEQIVLKCLQPYASDRYTTAGALVEDLGRFLVGQPVLARAPSVVRRTSRWIQRHPQTTLGLLTVLVLCSLISTASFWMTHQGWLGSSPQRGPPGGELVDSDKLATIPPNFQSPEESPDMLRSNPSNRNGQVTPSTRSRYRRPRFEGLENRWLMAAIAPPDGIVSWWTGDNTAADITGRNDGVLKNGTGFDSGQIAQSFKFDGDDDIVEATSHGLPVGDADRTIELWARIDQFNNDDTASLLASYGTPGTLPENYGQVYSLAASSNGLYTSTWGRRVLGPQLEVNRWYHLAVTNVGRSFRLYVDGDQVALGDMDVETPSGSSFKIGHQQGGNDNKLDGQVDEVSIYDRALSAAEIKSIYNAGADGKVKGNYITADLPRVEESNGDSVATFTIRRVGGLDGEAVVEWATADVSAISGSDYVASSGTIASGTQLVFADGESEKVVQVTIKGDTIPEPDETFKLVLSTTTPGYMVLNGYATIVNDDPFTKFYVVNDGASAATDQTYEYQPSGDYITNSGLRSDNTTPRGAASTAAGDKVWIMDANKKVYVYSSNGISLGSWTAGSIPGSPDIQGITTNGIDVWIVDAKSDKVYKYTGAASRLKDSQNAVSSFNLNKSNSNPKDLVTDGTYMWVVNDSSTDKVFKYNTLTGALVSSWTITTSGLSNGSFATNPTGITLDPSNASSLWIVDRATLRVYEYSDAVNQPNGTSKWADASFPLAPGNTNPQGIADPPAQAGGASEGAIDAQSSRSFSPIVSSGVPAIEPNRSANELDRSREMVRTLREELPTALLATSRQSNLGDLVTQSVRSESSAAAESNKTSQDSADLAFTGEAFEWLDDALLGMLAQSR